MANRQVNSTYYKNAVVDTAPGAVEGIVQDIVESDDEEDEG